ncbi:MAG: methyltransferase domain-containing protein [Bacteroidetes bacterium]|nr:methyltransferase domain-containing protein [Bacteroidota bacterium]
MRKTFRWKVAQSVELKWWKGYLNKKDKDDYLAWKRHYWKELLKTIDDVIKLEPGQRILDAGCGPAGIYIILNEQKVDALDPLLDSYEKTLEHFSASDYPNVNFHSLPLELYDVGHTNDIVFCMNAINHVDDLTTSMDVICRAVTKDGLLVLTIDAHNFKGFKRIFRMIPGDILHPHQYDLTEYSRMVTDRDMKILKTVTLKQEFFFDHYLIVAQKYSG